MYLVLDRAPAGESAPPRIHVPALARNLDALSDLLKGTELMAPRVLVSDAWFDAIQGLRMIRSLRAAVNTKPDAVDDAAAVLSDIAACERHLMTAHQESIAFHLEKDAA